MSGDVHAFEPTLLAVGARWVPAGLGYREVLEIASYPGDKGESVSTGGTKGTIGNGDKIGRNGTRGGGDAHLLILQAPQAENCSRVVFGWEGDFSGRREEVEEELSEGEPELCLMGIIDEEREREKRKERERKNVGQRA